MRRFNPDRLSLARKRRALTKVRLADSLRITTRTLGSFERGEREPPDGMISRFSEILGFPTAFFFDQSIEELSKRGASFRSLSTMTARQRDAVIAAGSITTVVNAAIEERFDLPVPDVPDLFESTPEAAAMSLRSMWNLGERPISNMVHLLESKGVRVYSLTEDCTSVDAFCTWHREIPFVFLNTVKSGERGRYDAAHELGHLVLHRHGDPKGRAAEFEANRFASAFLMPAASIRTRAPRVPSPNRLLELKRLFRVSPGAVVRRLYDLQLVSQWQYERACVEISKRGWRTAEPEGIRRERSQLLAKVFAELRADGVTFPQFAASVNLEPDELASLVFHLVMTPVSGGGSGNGRRTSAPLQLV